MPNDTNFAVMYKRLVDRNFEPDPERLTKTRRNLMGHIFAQGPPEQTKPGPSEREKQVWTKYPDCDKMRSEF